MNTISSNMSFKGNFLSADEVRKASERSKKLLEENKREFRQNDDCEYTNDAAYDKAIANCAVRAENIISYMQNLAEKLPDGVDLVLSKVKEGGEARYSLDVQTEELGKSQFMGKPGYTKWANSPDNYSRNLDLHTIEAGIMKELDAKQYERTPNRLWYYSKEPVADRILSKYIDFNIKDVYSMIQANKIGKASRKAEDLIRFAEQHCSPEYTERLIQDLTTRLADPENADNYDFRLGVPYKDGDSDLYAR